jgi:CubicO group peptidase (beta-lactamase class C family)
MDRGKQNERYGLSWWLVERNGQNIFYARGLRGQYIIDIPEKDLVIVRTGHLRDIVDEAGHPIDLYDWIDIGIRVAK